VSSEEKSERIIERSIEETQSPRAIAHPSAIHQAQNGAIHLSEQSGNRAQARLAAIFAASVTSRLQWFLFSRKSRWGGACCIDRKLASINELVSDFACFADLRRALDPKDLFDTLPLLAKPAVEVRARSEVAMLQPPMRFVPGFGLRPSPLIRARIFKQIGDVLPQRRLIIFDNQQVVSLQAMDLRTQRSLSYASHAG